MSRKIAIGDIHGRSTALKNLLTTINPQSTDTIITLGDYIDRGSNSNGVIEQLIGLKEKCIYHSLIGNHEFMLLRAFNGKSDMKYWFQFGGKETLRSYTDAAIWLDINLKDVIPYKHVRFIAECEAYYEDEHNIFVHAGYRHDTPMNEQTEDQSFWESLSQYHIDNKHISGKTFWVGHTPQHSGIIADHKHVVCIDTDNWLTAVDIDNRKILRTNEDGAIEELEWPI